MTKQQISVNSASYVLSHLAFRKTKLCALRGSGGSGFALAAHLHLPSSETPILQFLEPCKILHCPWARHVPLLSVKRSSSAEPGHAKQKPGFGCSLWLFLRWQGRLCQSAAEQSRAHSWSTAGYWAQASGASGGREQGWAHRNNSKMNPRGDSALANNCLRRLGQRMQRVFGPFCNI